MKTKWAKAFAPATVANVAVGFDLLGFALDGIGESVRVEKDLNSRTVTISPIRGFENISLDPTSNTAAAGLLALIQDKKLTHGFHITIEKNIPVGSGLGGSSTSAVASIVAANSLLKKKLTKEELLHYALIGEEVASGSKHADNIAPCLHGGVVYSKVLKDKVLVSKFKVPKKLQCVILLPKLQIQTKQARAMLSSTVPFHGFVQQTSNLAGFILGCQNNDLEMIHHCLKDVVIEPQRASLIPGFYEIQKAALSAGALGCSISGSGPALFALADSAKVAQKIHKAMHETAKLQQLAIHQSWVTKISMQGARIVSKSK